MQPPEVDAPSLPTDRGVSAMNYLAAYGLTPKRPVIRSSDAKTVLSDPFRYYLTRRLGLAPRLYWSKALNRGSWAHKAFELDPFTESPNRAAFVAAIETRLDELQAIAGSCGIVGQSAQALLSREAHSADSAWAWYNVHRTIAPNAPTYPAFPELFAQGKILARELRLVQTQQGKRTQHLYCVAQPDLLWLSPKGHVWLVDLKTCSESPKTRLATCRIEFQAQHYAHVFAWVQDNDPSQLPEEARKADLGGIIHLACLKPSIEFCNQDRNYTESTREITRGPRKGQTVTEREYHGEPIWENYLARCSEWLKGTGQYSHLAKDRDADPAVNFSFVPAPLLFSEESTHAYHQTLALIAHYATVPAHPRNFPMNPEGARDFAELSFWAPFYLNPVEDWPALVESKALMATFRDEDLTGAD